MRHSRWNINVDYRESNAKVREKSRVKQKSGTKPEKEVNDGKRVKCEQNFRWQKNKTSTSFIDRDSVAGKDETKKWQTMLDEKTKEQSEMEQKEKEAKQKKTSKTKMRSPLF